MKQKIDSALPPLAQYHNITDYIPRYGDFIVWSGWFTTWNGVVVSYDVNTSEVVIIFASIPFLLFTLEEHEMAKATRRLQLSMIKSSTHGTFAVNQHDYTRNATIWYI